MAESEKATSRRPRLPRFQFGIRTLLTLITLVALGLGFGVRAWQRHRDLDTIRNEMQGGVSYTFQVDPKTGEFLHDAVAPGPQWLREYVGEPRYEDLFCDMYGIGVGLYVTFRCRATSPKDEASPITDEDLEELRKMLPRLSRVRALDVATSSKVTDAGLAHLQGVKQLRILDLNESQVTNAGLQYLIDAVDLEFLQLYSTSIDDNLGCLTSFPRLKLLDLGRTAVSDEGLRHIEDLSCLERLMLDDTKITGNGLEHLAGLKSLQFLDLAKTSVTDASLETLATLPALEELDLYGTNVTDVGLKHLAGAKRLHTLFLKQTKVTDAGVEKLQQALPDCRIER